MQQDTCVKMYDRFKSHLMQNLHQFPIFSCSLKAQRLDTVSASARPKHLIIQSHHRFIHLGQVQRSNATYDVSCCTSLLLLL